MTKDALLMHDSTELADDDPRLPINRLINCWPRLFKGGTRSWSDLPAGWFDLTMSLCRRLDAELTDDEARKLVFAQVKEKFGGLRFHVSPSEDACTEDEGRTLMARVRKFIRPVCEASERTCQECGEAATTGNFGGHVATLCPTHSDAWELQGFKRRPLL